MKYLLRFLFLFPLCLALPACHHTHTEEGHAEEETFSFTDYSSRLELFVETEHLVAGKESHLHIYLTRLEDFKPVDSAVLKIHLKGQEVFSCEKRTDQEFCFVEIIPHKAGKDTLLIQAEFPDSPAETFLIPILVHKSEHEHADENEHEHEHEHGHEHEVHQAAEEQEALGINTVTLPKVMSYRIDFATEAVKFENVGKTISTTALISPLPSSQNEMIAKSDGIVVFNGNGIVEGMHVNKGDILFFIEDGDIIEKSMTIYYERIINEYKKAQKEYERKKELFKENIVSEAEFLETETDYKNAKVEYDNLQINASDNRRTVYAPATGFIESLRVSNGQFVEAGQSLLAIHQGGRHLLTADVAAIYYPLFKNISTAHIKPLNGKRTYSLEELNGKLLAYGQCATDGSPLLPLSFEIDITPELVPGTFVNLYLKTSGDKESLSVAQSALVEESGNFYVFVQITPELFDKRLVTIGISDGFHTEIERGLEEGERVVTKGAQILNLRQDKDAIDPHAGHNH